jgi:hypothetical protein
MMISLVGIIHEAAGLCVSWPDGCGWKSLGYLSFLEHQDNPFKKRNATKTERPLFPSDE